MAAAYHCLEAFRTLRHVLRYLQWDHGLRAIDVIHRVVLVADADPERYPLTALHLRHAENFLVPPVGWAPLFQELHRLLVDELEVPDGSGLRTALAASRHLLTWPGRTLPASIELEHDYVAYFQSTQASLFETGEPGTPTRPLDEHGPGTLEITADPLGVSQLFTVGGERPVPAGRGLRAPLAAAVVPLQRGCAHELIVHRPLPPPRRFR